MLLSFFLSPFLFFSHSLQVSRSRSSSHHRVQPTFDWTGAGFYLQLQLWAGLWAAGSKHHHMHWEWTLEWSHTYLHRYKKNIFLFELLWALNACQRCFYRLCCIATTEKKFKFVFCLHPTAVRCAILETPEHGQINCSNHEPVFSSQCSFTCDQEFSLKGHQLLSCDHHGVWSGENPTCQGKKNKKRL